MPQQIVIAEQLRIAAVLNDERVDELIVAQGRHQIGDVYLGTVENVLPGIDAAFVNIGESEKNGFIHITDLGPLRLKKGGAGITELLEPRRMATAQAVHTRLQPEHLQRVILSQHCGECIRAGVADRVAAEVELLHAGRDAERAEPRAELVADPVALQPELLQPRPAPRRAKEMARTLLMSTA